MPLILPAAASESPTITKRQSRGVQDDRDDDRDDDGDDDTDDDRNDEGENRGAEDDDDDDDFKEVDFEEASFFEGLDRFIVGES